MGTQNEAELDIQNEVELLEREIFLTALCPDSNLTLLISFAGKACSKNSNNCRNLNTLRLTEDFFRGNSQSIKTLSIKRNKN